MKIIIVAQIYFQGMSPLCFLESKIKSKFYVVSKFFFNILKHIKAKSY